jgi:hypothetical protein
VLVFYEGDVVVVWLGIVGGGGECVGTWCACRKSIQGSWTMHSTDRLSFERIGRSMRAQLVIIHT